MVRRRQAAWQLEIPYLLRHTAYHVLDHTWEMVLRARFGWFQRTFQGAPVLLISGGEVLKDQLRQQNVEAEDLEQAAREHGFADLSKVDMAVLEADGTISIIPFTGPKVRTKTAVGKRREPRSDVRPG